MAFEINDFLGNVAKSANIDLSEAGLANIIGKNLRPTLARVKDSASQQGSNPPVVAPTQYVKEQNQNNAVEAVSDFGAKYGIYIALVIGGLIVWKYVR